MPARRKTARNFIRLRRSRNLIASIQPAGSVSATEAKNEFGRILERAIRGETVMITKFDAPKAVLMSVDEFKALSRGSRVEIDMLSDEFDQLLAGMQTPAARSAMKAAFDASPKELGRAAVAAARKRG